MDQFLQELEASLGVPASLLERAAAARAGAAGASAEAVVRAWAGAGEAPASAPAATPTPSAEPMPAPPATPAAAEPADEPAAVAAASGVEVLEAMEPQPEPVDGADEREPAGVFAGFPGWLSYALLLLPILALAYVLIAPDGPGCGTSGQLAVDAETGVAENCDGTDYGVDVVSFFTIGRDLFNGSGRCAGCHAADGSGGTGPAMAGGAVLVTFPQGSCPDHIRWVQLGSDKWPDATYGATAKPVGGSGANMPGFEGTLTPEEIISVIIYERVMFGGEALADAEADCGATDLVTAGG